MSFTSFLRRAHRCGLAAVAMAGCAIASASDWPRFHGVNGSGVSADKQPLPAKWSDTENLKWKTPLPGPGSSSPIVVGPRVYVTCWSGFAADPKNEGDEKDLLRHVICLDRESGKELWDTPVKPVLPEDDFSGTFTQHGYASHTPVSDGERIYVFFGKTGVLAFDLDGNKLWQTGVGTGSGARNWGTASSPILYKDILIVPAAAESESLIGLNKKTGKKVWTFTDSSLSGTWGTPVLAECGEGRTDLVLAVPDKIWGLDPQTGKERWQCDGLHSASMTSSALAHDGIVYLLETSPEGGGTMAVKAGGEGDVTNSAVLWRGKEVSRIGTPIIADNRIYWAGKDRAGNETASCVDAATGKLIYRNAITGGPAAADQGRGGGRPSGPGGAGGRGGGGGAQRQGGGRGGRGGGMGGQDYSSPVMADGKIYHVSRSGVAYVYTPGPDYKLLSQNQFTGGGDFSATPAVSDGQIFIRSSKYLYCVAQADGK